MGLDVDIIMRNHVMETSLPYNKMFEITNMQLDYNYSMEIWGIKK